MYTDINFQSKKEVKEAIAAGRQVRIHNPGPFGPAPENGRVTLEGPHYPQPHKWYGTGTMKDGVLVDIK